MNKNEDFLLEDELSQQIRVEKHIAEIAKELEIKLEVISTGKISNLKIISSIRISTNYIF